MALGYNQAVFDESAQYRICYNNDVNGFTTPQAIRDRDLSYPYGRCGGHKFFLCKEFEPGNKFKVCRGKSA